jgi:hypothetical protein
VSAHYDGSEKKEKARKKIVKKKIIVRNAFIGGEGGKTIICLISQFSPAHPSGSNLNYI